MLKIKSLLKKQIYKQLSKRQDHRLIHLPNRGFPNTRLVSQSATDNPHRITTAKRLIRSYSLAKTNETEAKLQLPVDDLWCRIISIELKPLVDILASEDAQALSEYLMRFGENPTWHGGLALAVDGPNYDQRDRLDDVALCYLDKLIALGEAIGVLPIESPEQSANYGKNLYTNVSDLITHIEKEAGIPIIPPSGAVPVSGIDTPRGPLNYRHINAFYAALRFKELLPSGGGICEYGGGIGLVAYYSFGLSFQDYTILDLPLVNVFAAHFLINTLGPDAVRLYGEPKRKNTINVLPFWECMDFPPRAFALSFNQDSFPEIDPYLVQEYLHQIARTTSNYFLSINQEAQAPMSESGSQNFVPSLVKNLDSYHRIYRMNYWIRKGYAEELYKII